MGGIGKIILVEEIFKCLKIDFVVLSFLVDVIRELFKGDLGFVFL